MGFNYLLCALLSFTKPLSTIYLKIGIGTNKFFLFVLFKREISNLYYYCLFFTKGPSVIKLVIIHAKLKGSLWGSDYFLFLTRNYSGFGKDLLKGNAVGWYWYFLGTKVIVENLNLILEPVLIKNCYGMSKRKKCQESGDHKKGDQQMY